MADYGGWLGSLGGSGNIAGVSLGGEGFTGTGVSNQQIGGGSISVGPQVDLPTVIAGFEIRGLDTYTWQATFFSTNIYSDVSRAASSFANSVIGILNPMSYP
jgi:hypothetical protein